MPAVLRRVEGTPLWFKESRIVGAYAYGREQLPDGGETRTFELALSTAARHPGELAGFVTGRYRLEEYRKAISAASQTGRIGGVKTVFDLGTD